MTYNDSAAFRRALEARLLAQSRQSGLALFRLRKLVAFDRFVAWLATGQPGEWLLEGGVAMQLRLGHLAPTTKDIDLLSSLTPSAAYRLSYARRDLIWATGLNSSLSPHAARCPASVKVARASLSQRYSTAAPSRAFTSVLEAEIRQSRHPKS